MSEPSSSLSTEAPFHLEATVRLLQRGASPGGVDTFEDGAYRRLFQTPSGPALAEVRDEGGLEAPRLRLRLCAGPAEAAPAVAGLLRRVLGLDAAPDALSSLGEREPRLRRVAAALRGARPPRFATLFEAFANTIPFQQVSLEAGAAVAGRIVEAFGPSLERDGRLWRAFPEAAPFATLSAAEVVRTGLSRTKASALLGAARLVARGALDEEALQALPTEAAMERLRELQGIGPWSAGLICLRGLGRLDLFPRGDAGAERGLAALLHEGSAFQAEVFARRFGARRGALYFFALAARLLERGLLRAPA